MPGVNPLKLGVLASKGKFFCGSHRKMSSEIQWHAMGCQVTAISRGEKKKALAEKSGADGGLTHGTDAHLLTFNMTSD